MSRMRMRMSVRTGAFVLIGMLVSAAAQAGPCGDDVAKLEQSFRGDNQTLFVPTARQEVAAQLHRQPTVNSVMQAEQAAAAANAAFELSLARARTLDAAGDQSACHQALNEARNMIQP